MKNKTHSISILIESNSETVFKVVSGFDNYSDWNTIIPIAKGKLQEGTKLQFELMLHGKTRPFTPTVISVEMNKCFLLSKTILSKWFGQLTHKFEFRPLDNNQTEFVQTWEGKGIIVKLLWSKIENGFSDFKIFNHDLVKHVESISKLT